MSYDNSKSTKSLLLNKRKFKHDYELEVKPDHGFGLEPWKTSMTAKDGNIDTRLNIQVDTGISIENYQKQEKTIVEGIEPKSLKLKNMKVESISGKGSPNNRRKIKINKDKSPQQTSKKKSLIALKTDILASRKSKEEINITSLEKIDESALNESVTKVKGEGKNKRISVDIRNLGVAEIKRGNKKFLIQKAVEQERMQLKEKLREKSAEPIRRSEEIKKEKLSISKVSREQAQSRKNFSEGYSIGIVTSNVIIKSRLQDENGEISAVNRLTLDENNNVETRILDKYKLDKSTIYDENFQASKLAGQFYQLNKSNLSDLKQSNKGSTAASYIVLKSPNPLSHVDRSFENRRLSQKDFLKLESILPNNKEGFGINQQDLYLERKENTKEINFEPVIDSNQMLQDLTKVESAKIPVKISTKTNRGLYKGTTYRNMPRSLSIHEVQFRRNPSQDALTHAQELSLLNSSILQPGKQMLADDSKVLLSSRSRLKSVSIGIDSSKFWVCADKCYSSFERFRGSAITSKGIKKGDKSEVFMDKHLANSNLIQQPGQTSDKIITKGPLQMLGTNLITLKKVSLDRDMRETDLGDLSDDKKRQSPHQGSEKILDLMKTDKGKVRLIAPGIETKELHSQLQIKIHPRPTSGTASKPKQRFEPRGIIVSGQEYLNHLQVEESHVQKSVRCTPEGLDSFKIKITGSKAKYSDREGNHSVQRDELKSCRPSYRKSAEDEIQKEVELKISKHKKQLSEIVFESQNNTKRETSAFK